MAALAVAIAEPVADLNAGDSTRACMGCGYPVRMRDHCGTLLMRGAATSEMRGRTRLVFARQGYVARRAPYVLGPRASKER